MGGLLSRLPAVGAAYAGVVRSRSYFPLWLGQLLSGFGDTLHYIALVVLVFQLTGQGLAVAGLVAAERERSAASATTSPTRARG
jgi:hypothetical protein